MRQLIFTLLTLLPAFIFGQSTFSLDEAIQYGLEHSNAAKISNLEIGTAEAQVKEFRSIGIPKLNGTVDYSYYFKQPLQPVQDFISPVVYGVLAAEGLPTTTQMDPETFTITFIQPHQLNAGLSANTLLFDGSYLYGLKAAKVYKDLARKQLESTNEQIKANITKAYIATLINEINKSTIENNIQSVKKTLDEIKATYEAGFAESLDVDRLQLSYDNLTTQLENINQVIDLSYNLLKFQMGYQIDDEIILSEGLEDLLTKFDADMMLSEVTINPANRPEYELLEINNELNELDLKRNRAGYLPSARAFASYQQSLQRMNLFDGSEAGLLPTGVVGLNINVPIYDGGEKSAKIQQVKLNIERVNLQKAEFTRGMFLEVRNAQIAMQNAMRTLDNRKKSLDMTQSIYDRTKIKFSEGVGSSLEVTQAEGDLFQAQAAYTNALFDMLNAKVDLDIALGNL